MITIACFLGKDVVDLDFVKESDVESARLHMLKSAPPRGINPRSLEFRYWRHDNKGKAFPLPNRI